MKKQSTFAKKLIASLTEAVEAMEQGQMDRLTVHTYSMPPQPQQLDAEAVKSIRLKLGVSQAVFAAILGVSTILVQGWEQGVRKPSRMACRLLEEIERNPGRWKRMAAA